MALQRISAEIRETQQVDKALRRAAEVLHEWLGGAVIGVWQANNDACQLELVASSRAPLYLIPARLPYSVDVLGGAAQTLEPCLVPDAVWPPGSLSRCSVLAVPMLWRGTLVAVLAAFDETPGRVFGADEIQLVELLAQPSAAIIANRQMERRVQVFEQVVNDQRKRLSHVQAAIRDVLEQPDIHANLTTVVQTLQALGWQRVALALYNDAMTIEDLLAVGFSDAERPQLAERIVPEDVWRGLLAGELEDQRLNGMLYMSGGREWSADDFLFAPIRRGPEQIVGLIRLEDPVGGQFPAHEVLCSLDILIGQAAYIVEHARLLEERSHIADTLSEQVDELSMMHRADREVSAHLDVDRVMRLTMDWALRRTGADASLLMLVTDDRRGLVPSVMMGYIDRATLEYDEHHPMRLDETIIGAAASTGQTQVRHDLTPEDAHWLPFMPRSRHVSVPLAMRGEVLGVLSLASDWEEAFQAQDVSFLERLARRAAVALDNARLFRQSEQLADDMAVLYSASRTITSTLEHGEVLRRIAQSLAVALECSSALLLDYKPDVPELQVLAVYRLGTAYDAQEVLPEINERLPLVDIPYVERVVESHRPLAIRAADEAIPEALRDRLKDRSIHVMLLLPLVAQDELVGLAILVEGRHDRYFVENEIFKAEMLSGQASVALRQSMLYSEVLELEKLKSEMIRMASHDLRNPLSNVMGYIELLAMNLEQFGMTPDQQQYINSMRRSATAMKVLINDLLTLERIESERQGQWQEFDLGGLIMEVVESAQSSARLKDHILTLEREPGNWAVEGNVTQIRQAVANLVDNAIKYTPESGRIEVRFWQERNRLCCEVKDTGYGISPARQKRLFERFYRAQEPGTDHIGGTGLGLSLVKIVVERHGGQVWFESEPGQGSTFGLWLPVFGQDA